MASALTICWIAFLSSASASRLLLDLASQQLRQAVMPAAADEGCTQEPLPPPPTPCGGPTSTTGRGPILYQPCPLERILDKITPFGAKQINVPGGAVYLSPMPDVIIQPPPIMIRPAPSKPIYPTPVIIRQQKAAPIQPASFLVNIPQPKPLTRCGCVDMPYDDYNDYT